MFDLSKFQDDIGQLARLKTYTHLLVCFPLHQENSKAEIVNALYCAGDVLATAFPWLVAKVVHEGQKPGNLGRFKLATCADFEPPNSIVIVKDYSDTSP